MIYKKITHTVIILLTLYILSGCRAYSKISAPEMHQPVMLGPISRIGANGPEQNKVKVEKFKLNVGIVSAEDNKSENDEGVLIQYGRGSDISQSIRRKYYNETLKIYVNSVKAYPRARCLGLGCHASEKTSVRGGIYE